MAIKPTEDFTWAESAAPVNVVEPAAKRPGGWQGDDPLPSNNLNWIQRTLGRWTGFFDAMFGNTGRLQMDAANGGQAVVVDTPTEIIHQLEHDLGSIVAKSEYRADRLLCRRQLKFQGNILVPPQDGGDAQIQIDNLPANTCANFVFSEIPAHPFYTSSGIQAQTLGPTLAAPADASQAATFPRDAALYLGNLPKLTASIGISYDGAGIPSLAGPTGYNFTSATLQAPSGSYTSNTIDIVATQLSATPTVVIASRGYDTTQVAQEFIVEVTPTAAGARVTVKWFNPGTNLFVDALTTIGALANNTLSIYVMAM